MNRGTKIFLVLLRIVIGWHFLYEGVYKLSGQAWERPFTSEPYLQSASGPFRGAFRALISDQDGLARLKKEAIDAAIDRRYDDIIRHYRRTKPLSDAQQARLKAADDDLKASVAARLDDPDYERRLGEDEQKLADIDEALLDTRIEQAERSALQKSREEFRRKIARAAGKPATMWDGIRTREEQKKAVVQAGEESRFRQRLADYQFLLQRVRQQEAELQAPYTRERLIADRIKLSQAREQLLAIANAPVAELDAAAQKLVDAEQLRAGPLPRRPSQTWFIDRVTAWGLTLVGFCLLVGLFTPAACMAAAGFLAMFYFATPPWPGLPEPPAAEGHYYLVNKNLIELIAVLVLAAAQAGRWAGLDALLGRHGMLPWRRGRALPAEAQAQPAEIAAQETRASRSA